MVPPDNGILFSTKKKKESYQAMNSHGGTLNELLLSERSQSEKATFCMIPADIPYGMSFHMTFWEKQTMETVKRSVVARIWGK